eukprot:GFUD01032772.1.p1 GENE.GFUD01032772.1~~GFUD01032772.1.p1  ORF type:complete len:452 (+),score=167.88 GFUD01032772.1:192-1358(+)
MEDYSTLRKGTFLNDNMVNFYLKFLYRERLAEAEQDQVYVFSSMFYKRLTTDPVEGSKMANLEMNLNMSLQEKRHRRVKAWTKNVRLLDKTLVFIPICEFSHWYMVVLVKPGSEQPCLMVLDSLGGDNTGAVDIIREYLDIESRVRVEKAVQSFNEMTVETPEIPRQENGYDCGVFLLHYAEKMMERPGQFVTFTPGSVLDLTDWFPSSEVGRKRSDIAKLVRQLATDQAVGQETPSFPELGLSDDYVENVNFNGEPRTTPPLSPVPVTTPAHSLGISSIIQKEISRLSPVPPTTTHPRDRLPSQAPLFSSPAKSRFKSVARRKLYTGNTVQGIKQRHHMVKQPRMALFTKEEFYRGKPNSERLFDEVMEEEFSGSEEYGDIFSQEEE